MRKLWLRALSRFVRIANWSRIERKRKKKVEMALGRRAVTTLPHTLLNCVVYQ